MIFFLRIRYGVPSVFLLFFVAPFAALAQQKALFVPGAELQKLADNFSFTEGPAVDKDGNVFFTDQPNDRIMKWTTGGELITFMQPSGRANGLCFDAEGNLWACADEKNELWRINVETGEPTVLLSNYDGKLLNGPNDVWVRADGGAYFTDPFYRRPYWDRQSSQQDEQAVYFLGAGQRHARRVAAGLKQPNGLVGTADGRLLYVADIGDQKTYVYRIQPDGSLTDRKLVCEQGSDGMTIDDQGNIYLTGDGVTVYDSQGKRLAHIDVPERWTANVCFGGRDMQLLFITASQGLYAQRMNVRGAARQ